MSMYEASLFYGLKFDPKTVLKGRVKLVKSVVEKRKKFDPDTGERQEDAEVVKEPAHLVATILGKEFVFDDQSELDDDTKFSDLDDITLGVFYDEIFEFVAKKVGGEYGRGSEKCEASGQPDYDTQEHFFMIKGDVRELAWVAKTALPALMKMREKLKGLGIKVGSPRITLSCTEA